MADAPYMQEHPAKSVVQGARVNVLMGREFKPPLPLQEQNRLLLLVRYLGRVNTLTRPDPERARCSGELATRGGHLLRVVWHLGKLTRYVLPSSSSPSTNFTGCP